MRRAVTMVTAAVCECQADIYLLNKLDQLKARQFVARVFV